MRLELSFDACPQGAQIGGEMLVRNVLRLRLIERVGKERRQSGNQDPGRHLIGHGRS
jgi:hypothetical protein